MRHILTYLSIIITMVVLDATWIGGVALPFYHQQLGPLLAPNVNWLAACLFYVFYTVSIMVFVIMPAVSARSFKKAVLLGAFLGFTAYMTYDLTNQATTRDWPVLVTIVDILWGTVVTTVVSMLGYLVAARLARPKPIPAAPIPAPSLTMPPQTGA